MTDINIESIVPEGYMIASVSKVSEPIKDRYGKEYLVAIQLINADIGDIPRGTGMTHKEALEDAIAHIGGDDGLSKAIREAFQGERH